MSNIINIVIISLLAFLVCYFIVMGFFPRRSSPEQEELLGKINAIQMSIDQNAVYDSLISVRIDSLMAQKDQLEIELYDLRYQNFKTREANEKTYKWLNDLHSATGNRPDF